MREMSLEEKYPTRDPSPTWEGVVAHWALATREAGCGATAAPHPMLFGDLFASQNLTWWEPAGSRGRMSWSLPCPLWAAGGMDLEIPERQSPWRAFLMIWICSGTILTFWGSVALNSVLFASTVGHWTYPSVYYKENFSFSQHRAAAPILLFQRNECNKTKLITIHSSLGTSLSKFSGQITASCRTASAGLYFVQIPHVAFEEKAMQAIQKNIIFQYFVPVREATLPFRKAQGVFQPIDTLPEKINKILSAPAEI